MTYSKISDLPQTIRDVLPPDAQELYLDVYNDALTDETSRNRPKYRPRHDGP